MYSHVYIIDVGGSWRGGLSAAVAAATAAPAAAAQMYIVGVNAMHASYGC